MTRSLCAPSDAPFDRDRYFGSNTTHFTELLAERENIRLSVFSVRRILLEGGLRPARLRWPVSRRRFPPSDKPSLIWESPISRRCPPQAKGRIERLWQTFQDRLVIELRLRHVCTMEEANQVLPALIDKHNRLFAVKPQEGKPAYRLLPETPLELLFTRRVYRRISGGQTVSWAGQCYMPKPGPDAPRWEPKSLIEVRIGLDGQVWLWHQGRAWACVITQPVQTQAKPTAHPTVPFSLPRSLLPTIPGENPSPASRYSVARHLTRLQKAALSSALIPDMFTEQFS